MHPSIWDGINRESFEFSVRELERIAPSQRPLEQPRRDSGAGHQGSNNERLPLGLEMQLVDDFACLAAWQSCAECVAAASVSVLREENGLMVCLAANAGINVKVTEALGTISRLLGKCAARTLSQVACANACLEIILELHHDRILRRLRVVPIVDRLPGLISEIRNSRADASHADRQSLISALTQLLHNFRDYYGAQAAQKRGKINEILETSYELISDRSLLRDKLQRLGLTHDSLQRKEVRQLQALGNYRRICLDLSYTARSLRRSFGSLRIQAVEPFPLHWWQGHKHFVHAEVQLLLHHEKGLASWPPSYIGTSKHTCFLCYVFITAYGRYEVEHSHGEVYSQRTVPDLPDHSSELTAALNRAMRKTAKDVKQAEKVAKHTRHRHPPAAQSLLAFHLEKLRTPSASTIKSSHRETTCRTQSNDSSSSGLRCTASEHVPAITERPSAMSVQTSDRRPDSYPNHELIGKSGLSIVADPLQLFLILEEGPQTSNGAVAEWSDESPNDQVLPS